MVHDEAMSYLESFIGGGITSSNSNLQTAIDLLASNYGSSITKWNLTVNKKNTDRFDDDIKAFSYFWTTKYGSLGYDFDNTYIKAMIGVESTMGTSTTNNATKDVMQCLNKLDPAVYCMAKIAPSNGVAYDKNEGLSYGMKSSGYKAIQNIFNGSVPDASIASSRLGICFGILWLGYKTAVAGSKKQGIINYNGGGDPNYWTKVSSCYANPKTFFGV